MEETSCLISSPLLKQCCSLQENIGLFGGRFGGHSLMGRSQRRQQTEEGGIPESMSVLDWKKKVISHSNVTFSIGAHWRGNFLHFFERCVCIWPRKIRNIFTILNSKKYVGKF